MKYPYIIIDNDLDTTKAIQLAFEEHIDYICLGVVGDRQEGVNVILERNPKLVFLSIDLVDGLGGAGNFFVINELRKYMTMLPGFVIMSKSDTYAIESIRQKVLDYIVKPFDRNVLRKALLRYQNDIIEEVAENDNIMCFKSYGDYRFVNLDEVIYLKADNNTTDFILNNGQTVQAFKTLKHFQTGLPDCFVRIHNSYIVNSNYISRIHFGKSKCTMKVLKIPIPFSKSYKENVEEIRDVLSNKSVLQL